MNICIFLLIALVPWGASYAEGDLANSRGDDFPCPAEGEDLVCWAANMASLDGQSHEKKADQGEVRKNFLGWMGSKGVVYSIRYVYENNFGRRYKSVANWESSGDFLYFEKPYSNEVEIGCLPSFRVSDTLLELGWQYGEPNDIRSNKNVERNLNIGDYWKRFDNGRLVSAQIYVKFGCVDLVVFRKFRRN